MCITNCVISSRRGVTRLIASKSFSKSSWTDGWGTGWNIPQRETERDISVCAGKSLISSGIWGVYSYRRIKQTKILYNILSMGKICRKPWLLASTMLVSSKCPRRPFGREQWSITKHDESTSNRSKQTYNVYIYIIYIYITSQNVVSQHLSWEAMKPLLMPSQNPTIPHLNRIGIAAASWGCLFFLVQARVDPKKKSRSFDLDLLVNYPIGSSRMVDWC